MGIISIYEAAKRLNVRPSTMRRFAERYGIYIMYSSGKRGFVVEEELEKLLAGNPKWDRKRLDKNRNVTLVSLRAAGRKMNRSHNQVKTICKRAGIVPLAMGNTKLVPLEIVERYDHLIKRRVDTISK